ncbi:MAG: polyprenyl diphosphate synthase [Candidatus Dadabacteria bacterium]|nr:polyprenyl diphosphate synthase [Candidatus Dadabacteria bacterium]MCY4262291.1 polyprenyl diphosphate synthase [Candidatus Dadabacteria bacterium]
MQKNHDIQIPGSIPRHVVIIMDGNGRWARRKNLDRLIGHREGIKSARSVVRTAREIGIEYITLYTFSAQNWKRPGKEVLALMDLLRHYLSNEGEKLLAQNTRLNAIGALSNLPRDIRKLLDHVMKMTEKCNSLTITLALSYGGREEIINAVNGIIAEGKQTPVTENEFEEYLYTSRLPEPDLLIRTGGEMRLSNFLLWQLAYAEIYVTKTLWPNFRRRHLLKAIDNYRNRERRFGLTGEQIRKQGH